MKINFAKIPDAGLQLSIQEANWFPAEYFQRVGEAKADISLDRKNQRVLLDGRLQCQILLECDRCLKTYTYSVNNEFRLDIELVEEEDIFLEDHEHVCSANEMDVIQTTVPEIDLDLILNQQVHLAVPAKHICTESCKGICAHCGINFNTDSCQCHETMKDSPFAALGKLKKD